MTTIETPSAPTRIHSAARHSAVVRVTHAVTAVCMAALAFSGWAILVAHPHLYWGEIGNAEMPDFWRVPLPANTHHTGWGRGLHFLAAWILLGAGLVYVTWGLLRRHFVRRLWPSADSTDPAYRQLQRMTYLVIIFVVTPLTFVTGLAMSPGLTSAFPALVTAFGGHQSARTLHFLLAVVMLLFIVGHVAMAVKTGWRKNLRAIVSGGSS